jgi:HEAT repeat protein
MSRSIRKLVRTGDIEGLVAVLNDPSGDDREAALDGIVACMETHPASLKQQRAPISAACRPVIRDPEPKVRSRALMVLTALQDPSAPSLAVGALSDPASAVRLTALFSVFQLRPPNSLDDVLRLLSDEDPSVRRTAASTVERVGDRSAVPLLEESRGREKDANVRVAIEEVIEILEGRRPPTPIEPFLRDDA